MSCRDVTSCSTDMRSNFKASSSRRAGAICGVVSERRIDIRCLTACICRASMKSRSVTR